MIACDNLSQPPKAGGNIGQHVWFGLGNSGGARNCN
jgi:hypothetical protein